MGNHFAPWRMPLKVMMAALMIAIMTLAACSDQAPPAATQSTAVAATLTPADERLAGLYKQSCRSCHSIGAGGAPLTGDRAAWDPRWVKGMDALRTTTLTGLNAMPAGGQCFSCTAPDYEALITFMAGRESNRNSE